MPYEDLTTFDETDEDSDITVTSSKCDVSSMRRDPISHVSKSYGAYHFTNFDIEFEVNITSGDEDGRLVMCALSNIQGTYQDFLDADDGLSCSIWIDSGELVFGLWDAPTDNWNSNTSLGAPPMGLTYAKFTRSLTQANIALYSDSDRQTLIAQSGCPCSQLRYEYLHCIASLESSSPATPTITGFTQNFELKGLYPNKSRHSLLADEVPLQSLTPKSRQITVVL